MPLERVVAGRAARLAEADGRPPGHYGEVSDTDVVADAVAELYGAAPHEFISRRATLASQARSAGDQRAAKQITALRKPTQSAWVVNQLARTAPDAATRLTELGAELRAAQRTFNGTAIRELSQRRRELVDDLTQQALAAAGQQSPPAALRDEVSTTLAAALADPRIADEVAAGTLVRAARSDGFGSTAPLLSLVPGAVAEDEDEAEPAEARPPVPRRPSLIRPAADKAGQKTATRQKPPARSAPAKAGAAKAGAAKGAPAKAAPRVSAAAERKAERDQRRRVIADAEKAAAQTRRSADTATRAEEKLEATVEQLEEKLAEAREQLSGARLKARRARNLHRQAEQSLERKRGASDGSPPAR
jgi:hypothetical protein